MEDYPPFIESFVFKILCCFLQINKICVFLILKKKKNLFFNLFASFFIDSDFTIFSGKWNPAQYDLIYIQWISGLGPRHNSIPILGKMQYDHLNFVSKVKWPIFEFEIKEPPGLRNDPITMQPIIWLDMPKV